MQAVLKKYLFQWKLSGKVFCVRTGKKSPCCPRSVDGLVFWCASGMSELCC